VAVTASSLWSTHGTLWKRTFATLWPNRQTLVALTVLLWVPWRIVVPLADRWLGFQETVGFPLEWVADTLYEPLYAGAVLALLADANSPTLLRTFLRGVWLLPRLLLIDLKIAVWGLAAPYLVLHLGSAIFLTCCPSQLMAHLLIVATLASMVWLFVVVFRYFLAPAVLVSERLAVGRGSPDEGRLSPYQLWFRSDGVSTGWSLWAARRLVRGRTAHALLVLLVGQGVVLIVMALLPPGQSILLQVVSGLAMIATTLWWGLLSEFTRWCIGGQTEQNQREGLPERTP